MIEYHGYYLYPSSTRWFVSTTRGPSPALTKDCLLTDGTLGDIYDCWKNGYFNSLQDAKDAVDRVMQIGSDSGTCLVRVPVGNHINIEYY